MKRDEAREQIKSREEVLDKAFMDMCKGLDAYGPKEILDLLIINSRRDEIIYQLLVRFPTTVVLGEFLHTLPTIKVSKREFKKLQRKGCVI